MNATLTEVAPAKLNLGLYVGEKRADGLHAICSLFCPLTLADEVTLEPAASADADEVVCPDVPEPNLAVRALAGFRQRFGWDGPSVRLTIDKRVPVAAGLGGGSADAAAALRLAARASSIEPEALALRELAMSLGADVPSQLEPRLQLVTGAGEQLEPLDAKLELYALLLTGEDGLSTADVYAHADAMFPARSNLDELAARLRAAVASLGGSALALGELLHNDLQGSAVTLEPAAGDALDLLRGTGARVALVTGSGPTVFGLFESAADVEQARASIEPQWDGKLVAVEAGTG
ncbi:MAG: hypothetical protein WDZ37_04935 [Solirubrobacterales bacterium]